MYCIILFFIFRVVKCFNPVISNDAQNYMKEDVPELFDDSFYWNQGDIPLLNKKVFRGTRVAIREHPYIASVRRNMAHYCVATMLTKNLFVSVAHPFADVPIDELTIVVGENYADRGATLLNVVLVIIHEDFDPYTLKADLALLRVYQDTPYRCSVKSIQLVHPKAVIKGQRAFVTGWGRCDRTGRELCLPRSTKYTPGEKLDPMLRTVSFVIDIPNFYCEGYKRNGVNTQPGMLCVGHSREDAQVSSCLAVPGAPLVVNAHLVAILSWGFGCGHVNDLPLVYTSIQYYQPWLVHNIPILRQIPSENLTVLFKAIRADVLVKWLNLTRVFPQQPFTMADKPLEVQKIDWVLAKLRGSVYDVRDYLFDGFYHEYKTNMYATMREKQLDNIKIENVSKSIQMPLPEPFINKNNVFGSTPPSSKQSQATGKLIFWDERDNSDNDYY